MITEIALKTALASLVIFMYALAIYWAHENSVNISSTQRQLELLAVQLSAFFAILSIVVTIISF